MKLVRDRRAFNHPDLLTGDLNESAIAWVGDQHYRAVFKPKGNCETPLLGIYPMGSPCDHSLVGMFDLAADLLAKDDGPAMYQVPFSGFTDHRGMEASGQGFSNAYKFTTAWTVQGTIGLMTPFGIVAGGGCDKTFPMLIHVMGIEPYRYIPWALLHAGHRSVGMLPDGREVTLGDLATVRIRHINGNADDAELELVRQHTVTDVGVCENLASAMSNYVALCCGGFILAGEDLHAANTEARLDLTRRTIMLYRTALERGIVPADTIGPENFQNFIRAIALFGLSTNLSLHLPWMTKSWGITHTPSSIWQEMERMPWISDLQPVGKYPVNHIGTMLPSVVKYLVAENVLNDVNSVFGPKLSTLYEHVPDLDFTSQTIFRSVEQPMAPQPQIVLYRGNLCPGGAWVKESESMRHPSTYKVHVCATQADFFKDTANATKLVDKTCYVITGDRSTIELLSANFAIMVGLTDNPDLDVALLTDQRTSGFAGTRAKAAYHLPRNRLRQLKTGDTVCFAPQSRTIDLVDADGTPMDTKMDELAAAYIEPEWPKTGTIKDLINSQLSDAEDGCAIY
ncbi:MAG: dihydroxy-acid dehydratase [Pseudomonadota bacterium]